jgi:hypothetical protein
MRPKRSERELDEEKAPPARALTRYRARYTLALKKKRQQD